MNYYYIVLGFILSDEYTKLLLSYYIIFISLYITIKPIPNEPKNSLLVILETPIIKVKISFINKKGTKGLDKIKKLKSTTEWIEFTK